MKILCVDTATEACSAAVQIGDERDGIFEICPQQHSQRILPMVDELLKRNSLKLSELDAIAYGRGPGSFTGVRIASSTVQGLALGASLPVLEISTLQAMAQENFEVHGVTDTLALIDARMSEVYAGQFSVGDTVGEDTVVESTLVEKRSVEKNSVVNNSVANINIAQSIKQESVLPPAKLSELAQAYQNSNAYVGTGFHAYQAELGLTLQSQQLAVNYPNSLYMLPIAMAKFNASQQVTAQEIQPVYLRDKVTWKKLPNRE